MGVCSVLVGFALGSVQPMVMSLLHQITPAHRHGEALGLRLMVINASSVFMPMLFGSAGTGVRGRGPLLVGRGPPGPGAWPASGVFMPMLFGSAGRVIGVGGLFWVVGGAVGGGAWLAGRMDEREPGKPVEIVSIAQLGPPRHRAQSARAHATVHDRQARGTRSNTWRTPCTLWPDRADQPPARNHRHRTWTATPWRRPESSWPPAFRPPRATASTRASATTSRRCCRGATTCFWSTPTATHSAKSRPSGC